MMALFKGSGDSENGGRRDSYLARLHEIFGEDAWTDWPADEGHPIAVLESETFNGSIKTSVSEDKRMSCATQVNFETVENNAAETLEQVAEQIASKFTEAFVFAFREMGMEQGQTQALRVALSDISERVDRVTAELSAQPRKFDSVTLRLAALEERLSEHQNLGAEREERLRQLETKTNEHQEAVQQQVAGFSAGLETLAQAVEAQGRATAEVTEVSQTLQKRLDVQADAIRSAHSDAAERDERLIQLRAALEKAREAFASMEAAKALPEGI